MIIISVMLSKRFILPAVTTTRARRSPRDPRATPLLRPFTALAVACGAALLLSGCVPGSAQSAAGSAGTSQGAGGAGPRELRAPSPRLVYTYTGGVGVVDAATLEPAGDVALDGYNRISPAGDGRHVLVAAGDSFKILDAGVWTERHGGHGHSYAGQPALTEHAFEASRPGHVVRHAGRTVLFSDGSGKVEAFESAALGSLANEGLPKTRTYTAAEAHHGVALELEDGKLLVTVGDGEARDAVALLGPDEGKGRKEILRSQSCPGVHGEAVAGRNTVIFGCEDGLLVFKDGKFSRISSPDGYGRMGNQAGSPASPVVLADARY